MINISFEDPYVRLRTPYSYKDKCTAVPGGKWVPRLKCWEYLLTPVTAMTILQVFGKEVSDDARSILEPLRDRIVVTAAIAKDLHSDFLVPQTRMNSWHHQLVTYNMAKTVLGLEDET